MTTNNATATKPARKAPAPKRRMARPAAQKKVPTEAAPEPAPARETKKAKVIEMLQRPEGATLAQIMEATGWLKHTSSAFLTIQRGNGKAIESEKPAEGDRVYRLKA